MAGVAGDRPYYKIIDLGVAVATDTVRLETTSNPPSELPTDFSCPRFVWTILDFKVIWCTTVLTKVGHIAHRQRRALSKGWATVTMPDN